MTLPPNNDPRTWSVGDWCSTYEGSLVELAAELNVTRQALLHLRAGKHRRPPVDLLERLADALSRRSTFRRRVVMPTADQLVALWYREHGVDFSQPPSVTPRRSRCVTRNAP